MGPLDWTSEVLAAAYAVVARRAEAEKILKDLDERSKSGGHVPAYYLSFAYLALNDRDRTGCFGERLRAALAQHDLHQAGPRPGPPAQRAALSRTVAQDEAGVRWQPRPRNFARV